MIRKQNSIFKTSFVSDVNNNLKNTDCFAHVELDGYACYVVADGIDDMYGGQAARLCVDAIISAFTESPSINKMALKKYINIANKTLQNENSKKRLKASVMIIVHNYSKMRYTQAGNVRFSLYRDGFLKIESKDQSLSMDLISDERLPKDILKKHEERHNLYTYVGQNKEFKPFISKKIKLTNTDSIALYTRGFWENVDDGEILDIFKDAGTDPKETVNIAEDVLLSKQPQNLESYTFVTIFVEKIFIDPNKKRRIKKIILTSISIITTILIVVFILWIRYNKKQEKIELMNNNFLQTVEYILSDNYIKAEISCNETIELAKQVKDKKIENEATNYLLLIQNVIMGDDNLSNKDYKGAQNQYKHALERSRYIDKLGEKYIQDKLDMTSMYLHIYDLLILGDTLVQNLQYDKAEQKYLEAKTLSSKIYFEEGRQNSIKALEDLYEMQKELEEKQKNESDDKLEKENFAINFVSQGDKAFSEEDYESAIVFYESAIQKYEELEDDNNIESISKKIESAKSKSNEINITKNDADNYIKMAEQYITEKDYVQAKKYYLLAKNIYLSLKDDVKVLEINNKIEILDNENSKVNNVNENKEVNVDNNVIENLDSKLNENETNNNTDENEINNVTNENEIVNNNTDMLQDLNSNQEVNNNINLDENVNVDTNEEENNTDGVTERLRNIINKILIK